MKITMTLEKTTKNTFRFVADTPESDEIIPTLYIKKTAFKGQIAPEFITVTIAETQE